MFNIIITPQYKAILDKFLKKHSNIKKQYIKTMDLLETNPYHPSLRLHKFERNGIHLYSIYGKD